MPKEAGEIMTGTSTPVLRANHLAGEIDMANAPALEAALIQYALRQRSTTVVLDCSGLEFIDSSGLRMLTGVARACGKRIELVNVAPHIRRVFEVTGLTETFGIT
jgi:anti-sigma B factor antagonist